MYDEQDVLYISIGTTCLCLAFAGLLACFWPNPGIKSRQLLYGGGGSFVREAQSSIVLPFLVSILRSWGLAGVANRLAPVPPDQQFQANDVVPTCKAKRCLEKLRQQSVSPRYSGASSQSDRNGGCPLLLLDVATQRAMVGLLCSPMVQFPLLGSVKLGMHCVAIAHPLDGSVSATSPLQISVGATKPKFHKRGSILSAVANTTVTPKATSDSANKSRAEHIVFASSTRLLFFHSRSNKTGPKEQPARADRVSSAPSNASTASKRAESNERGAFSTKKGASVDPEPEGSGRDRFGQPASTEQASTSLSKCLEETIATIKPPLDMGRRYAKLCGDYNPIHTSSWLAPLMGQRGAISHGVAAADLAMPHLIGAMLDRLHRTVRVDSMGTGKPQWRRNMASRGTAPAPVVQFGTMFRRPAVLGRALELVVTRWSEGEEALALAQLADDECAQEGSATQWTAEGPTGGGNSAASSDGASRSGGNGSDDGAQNNRAQGAHGEHRMLAVPSLQQAMEAVEESMRRGAAVGRHVLDGILSANGDGKSGGVDELEVGDESGKEVSIESDTPSKPKKQVKEPSCSVQAGSGGVQWTVARIEFELRKSSTDASRKSAGGGESMKPDVGSNSLVQRGYLCACWPTVRPSTAHDPDS